MSAHIRRSVRQARPRWSAVLRALREASGETQEGWAAQFGVGTRTVQRWERGVAAPDATAEATLFAWCEAKRLFRRYDEGPLAGLALTPDRLRDLIASARVGTRSAAPLPSTSPDDSMAAALLAATVPQPLTALIGREQEIAAVVERLRAARLVTLTGPGGTGKTRVAQAVADALGDDYPDGVVFVALAAITDPNLVLPTAGRALGLYESGNLPPLTALTSALRDRTLLLVLDNCEQVLGAAPAVADLLAARPGLTILATSRAPLRIRGEREYPLPPLAVPDPAGVPPIDALAAVPAVRLFCERGRDVQPDFALTPESAAAVAQICRQVDGLPLALELAAARLKLFTPQALLARLDRRLAVLTGGPRDAPARQRTLRDTVTWSHDLLDEAERMLFRRLGVFAGGFMLEAVAAVCDADGDLPLDAIDGVTSLVDKNLVRRDDGPGGEPRFTMLETIREFAMEQLAASGELEGVQEQHATFVLALVRRNADGDAAADARLEAELDNIRATLRWCAVHDAAALGSRLLWPIRFFWYRRGAMQEMRRWAEQLLTVPSAQERTMPRARLLLVAGEGITSGGEFRLARSYEEESVAIARDVGDTVCLAEALERLGLSLLVLGEDADARPLLDESLTLRRGLGNRNAMIFLLGILSWAATRQGDATVARSLGEESLEMARAVGAPGLIAVVLSHQAGQAAYQGDDARARALWEESLRRYLEGGENFDSADARTQLARVVLRQGDDGRAATLLVESLQILRRLGATDHLLTAVEVMAQLAYRRGEPVRAAQLLAAAQTHRQRWGISLWLTDEEPYRTGVEAARAALDEDSFAAAWARGRAMSLDDAIGDVLALAASVSAPAGEPSPTTARTYPDGLTAREVEVLRLIAAGRSTREIADMLFISMGTVERHVTNLYGKIGARGRADATAYAFRHSLAAPPGS